MPDDLSPAPGDANGDSPPLAAVEPPIDDLILPPVDDHLLPYLTVAIGGSAGALEAYVDLLKGLPASTGMTFVLVSHLAPGHESHLVDILSRHTAMKVSTMANGIRPEPDNLYILPPNAQASIEEGRFVLEERPRAERVPRPIDHFFRALAADQKTRVIGIILSGSDADGSVGLQTIKGEGGIAIVQTPDSARFSQMPRSGIAADHVDLILPPSEIGPELARLARRFIQPEIRPLTQGPLSPDDERHFARIITLLKSVSGIDFGLYKPATLRRRIARRVLLKHVESLEEYARTLSTRSDELRELQEDVLINVTRFFRDADVFEAFRHDLLPLIFEKRPRDHQVRIWVPGCSTGEEAYSYAMCLLEHVTGLPVEPTIQIFGSDASDQSIEKARSGIYPESIAGDLSPERLRRFFVKIDHGYQVTKRVRDLCIFARQNVFSDPPFSRLDVVSCRNLLIYLGAPVQQSIINTFHYALKPAGFLILGNSETLREQPELFTPVDRKFRFYVKVRNGSRPLDPTPVLHEPFPHLPLGAVGAARESANLDLQRLVDRIILANYGPPGVVVNSDLEVLEVRGHTAPYLEIPPGAPSLNLARMARDGLAPALRDAVRRAIEEDSPVRIDRVRVADNDAVQNVNIAVLPIPGTPARSRCCVVLFLPCEPVDGDGAPVPAAGIPTRPADPLEVRQLRDDLFSTRAYLQSLVEERESRNQELTSAYEEVQSANEELQSSNEELETAKEMLQSSNEELLTVNEELRNRNLSLTQASNDLANLFNSVNIPVVMLGSDLTIRHFTPPTERFMHVRASDIGRPIGEIRLNVNIGEIEPLLHEVLETLGSKEVDVQDRDGRWHILRIRPYRTTDNRIDGLVLILLDVDQIRRGEHALREALDFTQNVVEGVQSPLVVLDSDLRIRTANAAFRSLSQLSAQDIEHRAFPDLAHLLWGVRDVRASLESLLQQPSNSGVEIDHAFGPSGSERVLHFDARVVPARDSKAVLLLVDDITDRRRAEKVLDQERRRLESEVQTFAAALGRTREELRALAGNLFTSQEDERRRVARELHDDIAQKLAVLEMFIEELRQNLPSNRDEVVERLEQVRFRTNGLSDDVRRISRGLHPAVLDDLGLPAALRVVVEEFEQQYQMPTTFNTIGTHCEIAADVASNLYRIAQEALRNVAKHAGKTHVRVLLGFEPDRIRLTVRDLGEGFDMDQQRGAGLGFLSMSERARLIGGSFRVESQLGGGTTIEVDVPPGEKEG